MAGLRQSVIDDVTETFNEFDIDGNGKISAQEIGTVMAKIGQQIPGYKLREMIKECDVDDDGCISFEEFLKLYESQHSNTGNQFRSAISKKENVETHGGMTEASSEGTTHSVAKEEQVAFSNWINRNLADDPDCKKFLPLNPDSRDLYVKCKDGIILCKLINKSQPGTIDERAINKTNLTIYRVHENLTLALNSAQSIGCTTVNIGAEDIHKGKPHLVLGLLWQIIRIGLLSEININMNPNLAVLLREGETLEDLMKLSPEEILLRWVNYHLEKANSDRRITNFSGDIKDSEAYFILLNQIAPRDAGVTTAGMNEHDTTKRAEYMLQEADKIGCRQFVSAKDVVVGNGKLNLAFVANLFNNYPGLEPGEDIDLSDIHEETREEKTYRNWMNSLGVNPFVNNIYNDLTNGMVLFQLYDIVKPGVVNWDKVNKPPYKQIAGHMKKIENCNYAVELGREVKFSLVGIAGSDIHDGNETLTLALVWQLMKAYTLALLSELAGSDGHRILEKEIVEWVNRKLQTASKSSHITGFNDPTISTGRVVLDLVDAVKPGSVDYKLVRAGQVEKEKLDNAKLAISMARKIGARVYALPEDIVEVKPKMVMTVFACIMIKDYQPPTQNLSS